ncbi:hypothetical protein BHE74_00051996 [Ensete ventricosum]|nr:hypothetical protein BHE74_00051996 [Ensete ventricosum]
MATTGEGNVDGGGGSSTDEWQREITVVEASSIVLAAMLVAVEGEKGDGGSSRSGFGIIMENSVTGVERDYDGRWLHGYRRQCQQPTMTWLAEEEEQRVLEGDASSIVQVVMLTATKGEKGDGSGIGAQRRLCWRCGRWDDKVDRAATEALGSTSKGWYEQRLQLHGLQAVDEDDNSNGRCNGNGDTAAM